MSLNARETAATSRELHANLDLTGLTPAQVADELGVDEPTVRRALDMKRADPAFVWRLRDHLEAAVRARGLEPVPYSRLTDDMRGAAAMWFGIDPRKPGV